jgi:hypothetical protein
MNPTKTGLYSTNVGDRFILLYWDGEDWVDQDGIRPCYKKIQWTGKPLFVPALRTWQGLEAEDLAQIDTDSGKLGITWRLQWQWKPNLRRRTHD